GKPTRTGQFMYVGVIARNAVANEAERRDPLLSFYGRPLPRGSVEVGWGTLIFRPLSPAMRRLETVRESLAGVLDTATAGGHPHEEGVWSYDLSYTKWGIWWRVFVTCKGRPPRKDREVIAGFLESAVFNSQPAWIEKAQPPYGPRPRLGLRALTPPRQLR